ncbi:MAG: class I SAM-dependent methyltransferase [Clostridia bacterium]|nr:class I SAM-dependent methyltransferase [Clostridia bacterium]
MSKENEKTLEVYKNKATVYLETSIKHDNLFPEKAKKKREELENFIKRNMETLPKEGKVFEIGSGDGSNAKYIEELGYKVIASDIADGFINEINSKGLKLIRFNALKDEFTEKYCSVFCWRVFVHFTKEDASIVLKKVYNVLEDGGLFIFNAMNREIRDVDEEWVDFSNEYHMGAERYYKYFSEKELNEIIAETGYKIYNFHKEGGESNNKWLVYVLKK